MHIANISTEVDNTETMFFKVDKSDITLADI